jgi:hypothetical protein
MKVAFRRGQNLIARKHRVHGGNPITIHAIKHAKQW